MSELLTKIGSVFRGPTGQGLAKVGELGAAGAGLAGNISAEHQRSQVLDRLKQQEAQLGNPQQLANEVAGMTQPLQQGLVQSVGNNVNADLAERGLSQSPGIGASVLSQALAPYQQQNQQQALQLLMQRLGLPLEYAQVALNGMPQSVNLAPLLALLQQQKTPSAPSNPPFNPAGGSGNNPAPDVWTNPGDIWGPSTGVNA